MEKVWEIADRKFDDLIDQILYNRGIIKREDSREKESFLSPDFSRDLSDPFLIKNLERAVDRIKSASDRGEKVGIFSDYDADGVPAAALLYRAFQKLKLKTFVYIPDRENGYGLSVEGIDYLVSKGCSLIVTADLGIRNFKEALYCKKIGVELIITDHHLPDQEIPSALVINPKQEGDHSPFKELCGCGVAFKLVCGLRKHFVQINERFLKWNLDLVGISTIADMVPLVGENRVLAKYGLKVISKSKNIGIACLIKSAGIESENLSAYQVGFQIAPRINAPGRLDRATKSFELLVTEEEDRAKELSECLNEKNEERQIAMAKTEAEVCDLVAKEELNKDKIIVVAGDWSKGVIGPSASRIVDKYYRPSILFSKTKDAYIGSARSISGVSIIDLLEKAEGLIEKYGGHHGAAGVTVKKSLFSKFCQKLRELANDLIPDSLLFKKLSVDAEVEPIDLSMSFYEDLINLEPFGFGNPRPVFSLSKVSFSSSRFVGKEEKHLSAIVNTSESSKNFKAIFFSYPYEKEKINKNSLYNIAFNLDIDEWQGRRRLSLNIIDMKLYEK